MASYEETRRRLEGYKKDAEEVRAILADILDIFTEYQIDKLSGVDLDFKAVTHDILSGNSTIKPVDAGILEIKAKVKKLVRLYSRRFPHELAPFSTDVVEDFKCLPVSQIFGSPELKTASLKSYRAITDKINSINGKTRELNKYSFDSALEASALQVFYERANFRILDSVSTEESILEDYRQDMANKDKKIKDDTNKGVEATKGGGSSVLKDLWDTLGLKTVPALNVIQRVDKSREFLRKLQYPQSLRNCDEPLNRDLSGSLVDARDKNAESTSSQSEEALRQNDESRKGYGAEYAKSPEYVRLRKRALYALAVINNPGSESTYKKEKSNMDRLDKAIQESSSRSAVRNYLEDIRKLISRVSRN